MVPLESVDGDGVGGGECHGVCDGHGDTQCNGGFGGSCFGGYFGGLVRCCVDDVVCVMLLLLFCNV